MLSVYFMKYSELKKKRQNPSQLDKKVGYKYL